MYNITTTSVIHNFNIFHEKIAKKNKQNIHILGRKCLLVNDNKHIILNNSCNNPYFLLNKDHQINLSGLTARYNDPYSPIHKDSIKYTNIKSRLESSPQCHLTMKFIFGIQ